MLAVHIDSLLFLLLAGIALLTRLLASKAGGASQSPEDPAPRSSPPPPIPRAPVQSEEEQIRKFLEALGQPPTSKPPPAISPRESAPTLTEFQRKQIEVAARERRRRNILNPIPPLTTVPPPEAPRRRVVLPRQMTEAPGEPKTATGAAQPPLEVQAGRLPAEPPAVQTAAEAYAIAGQAKRDSQRSEINIAVLLRSSSGLRNAIILREIFGPPRSLQPFADLVGSA